MAITHAASGQIVDVQALGEGLVDARTVALFKTDELEVMRLVMQADKTMPSHSVKGEITIHCLEGEAELILDGRNQRLKAGQMVWLEGSVEHGLMALRDSSLLLTIVLRK